MRPINPITRLDYPDPDIIRVDDTYYFINTSMHFFPGCEILKSYDLCNWEHAAFVYDRLDSTPGQKLEDGVGIFGKGMWAATLRYHKGTFYVVFVANDTQTTYLYRATYIEGPWQKSTIEGFYHDCSLLFDDDDRIYIVYGNKNVYITELKPDLTGPLEGGLHRLAVSDEGNPMLGYEGAHFYKLNGKYYLFFIHSKREYWRRTEACFVADSIDGEFVGGDVFDDDRGYCGSGVAQGTIVDTPDGNWYSVLFQDSGAVGRLPILIPMHWENDLPVIGVDGKVPDEFEIKSTRPNYEYAPLVGDDDFKLNTEVNKSSKVKTNNYGLKVWWQFNHEPNTDLVKLDSEAGTWSVTTDTLVDNPTLARNTITQRMTYPGCDGEVTIDCSNLKEGDYAGLLALQGIYGMVGVTRRDGSLRLVTVTKDGEREYDGTDIFGVGGNGNALRVKLSVDFTMMNDTAQFYAIKNNCNDAAGIGVCNCNKLGDDLKLAFRLDHFVGCRFGLVMYSTKEIGGTAAFSDFKYTRHETAETDI